jgi:hypothetical protein
MLVIYNRIKIEPTVLLIAHYLSSIIDEYESLRPIMTRCGANLAFPSELRVAMLLTQGTCMRDILHVKRESQKIRRARMKSIQSIKWDGVNEALESASRTAKKLAAKPFLMLSKKKTINRDAPY